MADAGAQPAPKLAARRPDWELPKLHSGLQLSSLEPLYANKDRAKCPKCGRSRVHYCYDCVQPLVPFPHVALPFRVSIVTHHEERASKNTGVQVAVLAAGQVDLHSMSDVPRDVEPSRCAVLFPSDTALEVEQLEPDSVDRLFIIDSRWKKAGELVRSEAFSSMRAVKLRETKSAFWRFHTRGVADEGVCTVEALYFFLVAMAKLGKLSDPRFTSPHAFDDLLWYFAYQHQVVQQAAQRRLEGRGAEEGAQRGDQAPDRPAEVQGKQRKQHQHEQGPKQGTPAKSGQQKQAKQAKGKEMVERGQTDGGCRAQAPRSSGGGDSGGAAVGPSQQQQAQQSTTQPLELGKAGGEAPQEAAGDGATPRGPGLAGADGGGGGQPVHVDVADAAEERTSGEEAVDEEASFPGRKPPKRARTSGGE